MSRVLFCSSTSLFLPVVFMNTPQHCTHLLPALLQPTHLCSILPTPGCAQWMKIPLAIIQDQANQPPTVSSKPYTSDNPCEEQNCFKASCPLKVVRICRSALQLCVQPDQENRRKTTLSPCRPECHWRAGRNVQGRKDRQSFLHTHPPPGQVVSISAAVPPRSPRWHRLQATRQSLHTNMVWDLQWCLWQKEYPASVFFYLGTLMSCGFVPIQNVCKLLWI